MSANYDPAELTKFSQMAETWWDSTGENRMLHAINPLRLSFIKQYTDLKNKYVLDVGCGGGILTESLASNGAIATGIDLNPDLLKVANSHAQISGYRIDYELTAVEDFAESNPSKYDIVTCMELLEHVPDPSAILTACAKLVKPGGHLFFSTINRTLKAYLFAVAGAEYLLQWLPRGTHEYAKFIRPAELDNWARRNQLRLIELCGMNYSPLKQEFYLDSDVNVNYLTYYQRESL